MRNALQLTNGFIVTTDNSGAIGQKEQDVVKVPDDITSYFSARVTLLEQWAAMAQPEAVIIHNFSGEDAWGRYVNGIRRLFGEIGIALPKITGSTESNMQTLQSGLAVTMIGEPTKRISSKGSLNWFTYGKPLVGEQLIEEPEKIANMKSIYVAMQQSIVERIWPVGSKGIAKELQELLGHTVCNCKWDIHTSAGPSTVVLLGIHQDKIQEAKQIFGELLIPLDLNTL
ncbi:alpha-ribazole-5-phosphate synthase [Rummeliibacillus sp. JY-2-4R]